MSDKQPNDYVVGPGKPPREHQFKKGMSGNPGGRAKVMSAAYREVAAGVDPTDDKGRHRALIMALALYDKAKAGDVQAIKEFSDRLEGKARQTVSITDDRREQLEAMIEQMIAELTDAGEECDRERAIMLLRPAVPELEHLQ